MASVGGRDGRQTRIPGPGVGGSVAVTRGGTEPSALALRITLGERTEEQARMIEDDSVADETV
jgi:hypothetical protein